jgi:hypothetical protein
MKKVILAIAILSLGIAEANAACNSETVKGAYGYTYSAFVPSAGVFCAGVGLIKLNGVDWGTVSGVDSCNGNAFNVSGQGGYFVRANCTGEAAVTFSNGGTGRYYFTVVNNGKQGSFVITTQGITGAGTLIKRTQ